MMLAQRARRFEVGSVTLFDRTICSERFARILVKFLIFATGWILGYFQVKAQTGF